MARDRRAGAQRACAASGGDVDDAGLNAFAVSGLAYGDRA